jgi:hypothetical protein
LEKLDKLIKKGENVLLNDSSIGLNDPRFKLSPIIKYGESFPKYDF